MPMFVCEWPMTIFISVAFSSFVFDFRPFSLHSSHSLATHFCLVFNEFHFDFFFIQSFSQNRFFFLSAHFGNSISISVHTFENIPLRNNIFYLWITFFLSLLHNSRAIGSKFNQKLENYWYAIHFQWYFVNLDGFFFVWKCHNNHSFYILFVLDNFKQTSWFESVILF